MNIVIDFTPEGRKLTHPTPASPAYYLPIATDFQELGSVVAGEKPPAQHEVLHNIAVALADQNYRVTHPQLRSNAQSEVTYADGSVVYVPANPESHGRGRFPGRQVPLTLAMLDGEDGPYSLAAARKIPVAAAGVESPVLRVLRSVDPVHGAVLAEMPSLILMVRYGYMNPNIVDLNGRGQRVFFNQDMMLGLVGGSALSHIALDFQREDIMQAAEQDRYFIMVTAYDFPAYVAKHKKVTLWQAKISTPSQGIEKFADIAAALISAGASSFGHETATPVVRNLHRAPDGRVEVGPLTVKGVSEPAPPSPAPKP